MKYINFLRLTLRREWRTLHASLISAQAFVSQAFNYVIVQKKSIALHLLPFVGIIGFLTVPILLLSISFTPKSNYPEIMTLSFSVSDTPGNWRTALLFMTYIMGCLLIALLIIIANGRFLVDFINTPKISLSTLNNAIPCLVLTAVFINSMNNVALSTWLLIAWVTYASPLPALSRICLAGFSLSAMYISTPILLITGLLSYLLFWAMFDKPVYSIPASLLTVLCTQMFILPLLLPKHELAVLGVFIFIAPILVASIIQFKRVIVEQLNAKISRLSYHEQVALEH